MSDTITCIGISSELNSKFSLVLFRYNDETIRCLNLSKRVVDTCKGCMYSVPALLSGTLKTFQKAACDDQQVSLRCPAGTCISVLIAQYGNSAKDLQDLCPEERGAHPRANLTCLWPTSLQVNINWS